MFYPEISLNPIQTRKGKLREVGYSKAVGNPFKAEKQGMISVLQIVT